MSSLYDDGYIQLHYYGAYDASKSKYVGGKEFKIGDFFVETLDWFHLHLKMMDVELVGDYKMWHKPPNEEIFVEISTDKAVEKMLEYLTVETPVDLYIEQLEAEEEENSEEESSGPASSSNGTDQYVWDFMTYKINDIID